MYRLIYPLIILACLTVIVFSTIDIVQAARAASWPTTEGKMYGSRMIAKGRLRNRVGSETIYTYENTIEYVVDGKIYYITRRTISAQQSMSISYNPKNPAEAWMGPTDPNVLDILLALIAIVVSAAAAHRWTKSKEGKH